jgi:hypothetical protein
VKFGIGDADVIGIAYVTLVCKVFPLMDKYLDLWGKIYYFMYTLVANKEVSVMCASVLYMPYYV